MSLENLIDSLRINKFTLSVSAFGLPQMLYGVWGALSDGSIDVLDMNNIISGATIATSTFLLALPMHRRRKRSYEDMKKALGKKGYDERLVKDHMDHPCGRMIVKTALKRTGNGDRYRELKELYPLVKIF